MRYSNFDAELLEISKSWLEVRFDGYEVAATRTGLYGRVFFLEAREDDGDIIHRLPRKIAVKSVRLVDGVDLPVITESFERELRTLMPAQKHLNLVPFNKIMAMPTEMGKIPFASMPFCDLNLREWCDIFGRPDLGIASLILASICNGLHWAYEFGIEGHGDLKLENIMARDMSHQFKLKQTGYPSSQFPWVFSVADFGWANIWKFFPDDTQRGFRPYLAPERYEGTFVPCASDVFSVGVLGSELLQGIHPEGHDLASKKLKSWKPKRWHNWSKSDKRELAGIKDEGAREVIRSCLSCNPQDRPEMNELIGCFARIAREEEANFEIGKWLAVINAEFDQQAAAARRDLPRWIDKNAARFGKRARLNSIANGKGRLASLVPDSPSNRTDWLHEAYQLAGLMIDDYSEAGVVNAAGLARDIVKFVLEGFYAADYLDEKLCSPIEIYGTGNKNSGIQMDYSSVLGSNFDINDIANSIPLEDSLKPRVLGCIGWNLSFLGWSLCAIAASTGFDQKSDSTLMGDVKDRCKPLDGIEAEAAAEIIDAMGRLCCWDQFEPSSISAHDLVNWMNEGYDLYTNFKRRDCVLHDHICNRIMQRIAEKLLNDFWEVPIPDEELERVRLVEGLDFAGPHQCRITVCAITRCLQHTFRANNIGHRVKELLKRQISTDLTEGLEKIEHCLKAIETIHVDSGMH